MALNCIIAPSPEQDWVELSGPATAKRASGLKSPVQGRLLKKHILNYGTLLHPLTGAKINVDRTFVGKLKSNFAAGYGDIVQVPLANKSNEHDESPDRNTGEVLGIEDDPTNGKVYALVDARKHADDFGKTLLGASAFMHLDYKDSRTNRKVGPTLLHVAVTNRPYVTNLDPYEDVLAASAEVADAALVEMSRSDTNAPEGHMPRSLSEILSELATDHGVAVPGDIDDAADLSMRLSNTDDDGLAERLVSALRGTDAETRLSASDISNEDIVAGVAELGRRNVALSASHDSLQSQVDTLYAERTADEVDALIDQGRILPAKREVFLTMALTDRETFEAIVPDEPLVSLSAAEAGVTPRGSETVGREWDVDREVARLTAPDGPGAQYVR